MVKNFLSNLGNNYKGLTLKERLMGQQMPSTDEVDIDTEALKGIDTSNPYFLENYGAEAPTVNITASSTPRKGGILPDLASGYRENYATGFAAPNWGQNQLDDGRNKGFAYRLGEGLGTVGRFIDSPLGRGLIAAGLNKALGYDNSLQEGLTAAVGRQNAQARNDLYRKSLEQQGLDTTNIRGNIDDKMYQNYSLANYRNRNLDTKMQLGMLKDNTSRARLINTMLTNGTITPAEAMERMAEYGINIDNLDESNQTKLLPYKQYALKVAPTVALGNLGVNQGRLNLDEKKFNTSQENPTNVRLKPGYNDNLAFYVSMPVRTKEERQAKANARADFIKEYGIDPEKQLGDDY